jgi:phosphotransferase system enzyme I (PtsP)
MPRKIKDKVGLVCDVAELASMFAQTTTLDDFLDQVVRMVAYHMHAAVCSIYLYDEQDDELILAANRGLRKEAVNQIHLKPGEGIIGYAFAEQQAVNLGQAVSSPHYKFIPDIDEEMYQAFLVAPIIRGLSRIGILAVQDPQPDYFDDNDMMALRAIAAQLATTIESAKLLLRLQHEVDLPAGLPPPSATDMVILNGTPVADGIAHGRVTLVNSISTALLNSANDDTEYSEQDFDVAVQRTIQQLEQIHYELENQYADIASLIFSAHLLILKSSSFISAIKDHIKHHISPLQAIARVVDHYVRIFSAEEDIRFREKALDVQDLGHRLALNLTRETAADADYTHSIVVAEGLVPSDILRFSAQRAQALILIGGNANSHVSILARALKIPTIVLPDSHGARWRDGDDALIDASHGTIYLRPTEHVLNEFRRTLAGQKQSETIDVLDETVTRDGIAIKLLANINLLSEVQTAVNNKAEGIGLYRSEFPFIVRNEFPSEEEQYRIYRALIEAMPNRDVVLRTLDIGGDKMLSYMPFAKEENPFLGLRAIRFSLRNQSIFAEQLRAMLRSGVDARLKIMFPLISSLDDFLLARDAVDNCLEQLAQSGLPHHQSPQLGAMIELPSAVEVIDELAAQCDFLCIGTNDLTQYMLAVDRTNTAVASFYRPHHPAVLRALERICSAGRQHDTEVSICGEIASNADLLPFLIGIGLRRLSLDPEKIPATQRIIMALDSTEAAILADELLQLSTIRDIEKRLGINQGD